ncbi:MAG: glycosyltransferase family 9 protein [Waddliaceae bacterium]
MMKVLVIKTSSLGDIIHAFPVVDWIRQQFPLAEIDWVVEAACAELVQSHPHIHQVLAVHTKAWRRGREIKTFWQFRKHLQKKTYDVVFDLQGNSKSGVLTFLAYANIKVGFGWKSVAEWPNILFTRWKANSSPEKNIRRQYLELVQGYFHDNTPLFSGNIGLRCSPEDKQRLEQLLAHPHLQHGPNVMVCPGSAWKNKQMRLSSLIEFLHRLHEEWRCCYLLIWGNEEEKEMVHAISQQFSHRGVVVEKMSIPALQHLMARLALIISVDSFCLHLAGTTKTPTFSVFGPSSAETYHPIGSQHTFYQGVCPYRQSFRKRCPYLRSCPTGACIRLLNGREIYWAFKKSGASSCLSFPLQRVSK